MWETETCLLSRDRIPVLQPAISWGTCLYDNACFRDVEEAHVFRVKAFCPIRQPSKYDSCSFRPTTWLLQHTISADDVSLLARSLKALKETFHKLQNEATVVGLNINADKTKYMQIKSEGTKDITHLKTDNFAFDNIENFNYLGSILNADNKMNIEIAERIVKGNKAYYANAKLIKSKFLKRNTKTNIRGLII